MHYRLKVVIPIVILVMVIALGVITLNRLQNTSDSVDTGPANALVQESIEPTLPIVENPPQRVYTNETVTESTASLVQGFPDFPLYPGLRLDNSFRKEQVGKVDYTAIWYFDGEETVIPMMKWYTDKLTASGWQVKGPYVDESEGELRIDAENSTYSLRLYNSERSEGETSGPGNIFVVDFFQK